MNELTIRILIVGSCFIVFGIGAISTSSQVDFAYPHVRTFEHGQIDRIGTNPRFV
ncbi:MAG: hypothetical protein MZU97_16520 [Bacillus subtilis]|nr:hypothetical protein [Bacillus subtilis]